ncbi:MAG: efflux RND transporter permease subunit [Aquimonas sp.]|nr:efflux RND transporter permease subunit [Aquimonas sp.]
MNEPVQREPVRATRLYRGLTHAAIRRPIGTLAIASVVLVLGLFLIGRLPVNLLPEVVYPLVRVVVNVPGSAAEVLEEQVTRPLERQLSATEGVVRIASEAEEGRTDVNLIFRYGTDLDLALQNAGRLLEQVRPQLPNDIETPQLGKWDPGASPVFEAGFSSSQRSPREVRDWLDRRLAPQLQSIPGVAAVEAAGGQVRELEVVVDQQRLRAFGLALADVSSQLAQDNLNLAAGNITSASLDVMARTEGRLLSVEEVAAVLLRVPGSDRRIRLDEVAEVRDGFREQRLFVRLDGKPAVQLSVLKQPDANTVAVVDELQRRLGSLQASGFIPSDIRYGVIRDGAYFVRGSVSSVSQAALLGSALAMLVVLMFLGSLRKSLVVGLSIPLAVMATFAMMAAAGLSLNVMSLGGLALGVGLLLDNAIVMLENIARHRERLCKSADEAAHAGADEVMSAITAGTLTNLAAVGPFLMVAGLATLVFRELLATISFAVVASLAVALTVVPMLAAQFGRLKFSSGFNRLALYRGFDAGVERLAAGYRRLLRKALRRWLAVLAAGLFAFLGSLWLLAQLGSEFLPQLDDGQFNLRVALPVGATPQETDEAARRIETAVAGLPHVQGVFTFAGGFVQGGQVNERPGRINLNVRLDDASERPDWPAVRWVGEARRQLEALDIPGSRVRIGLPGIRGLNFGVTGEDIELRVTGDDLGQLQRIATELVAALRELPGLGALELQDEDRSPQLRVDVDRERAAALGVDVRQVGSALRDAVRGAVPTRFASGIDEYDMRVRLPREQVADIDGLGQVIVGSAGGQPILASQVASFSLVEAPSEIARENQVRVQRVVGTLDDDSIDLGSLAVEVQRRIAAIEMPPGYGVVLGGQFETLQETRREMQAVIALAVFLVFVVLAVQYEKLSSPLVIMTAAPLAIIGSALALWLAGLPVSAPVFLGLVLLIGIVVNNAILLVEYVERRQAAGDQLVEALVEAGGIRLRPILMTTLTTVAGMLPLAIGADSGGLLMQPLAVAVVGGLLSAMLLTLFVVPCLYLVVQRAVAQLRRRLLSAPEQPLTRAL